MKMLISDGKHNVKVKSAMKERKTYHQYTIILPFEDRPDVPFEVELYNSCSFAGIFAFGYIDILYTVFHTALCRFLRYDCKCVGFWFGTETENVARMLLSQAFGSN